VPRRVVDVGGAALNCPALIGSPQPQRVIVRERDAWPTLTPIAASAYIRAESGAVLARYDINQSRLEAENGDARGSPALKPSRARKPLDRTRHVRQDENLMLTSLSLRRAMKLALPLTCLPLVIASCSGAERKFDRGAGGARNEGGSNNTAGSSAGAEAAGAPDNNDQGGESGEGGASGNAGATENDAGAGGEPATAGSGGTAGDGTASGGTANGGAAGGGGKAGAGTGGAASGSGGAAAGSGGAPPVTVPTIVSVTPTNNAGGVLATTPVKLTFSEAMDTAAVEKALTVSSVAASGLTFSWGSASTVLTITANAGWSYATGTSSSLAALKYTVTLGTAAKDAQGTALGATFSSAFSTRRRITHTFASETAATYSNYGHAVGGDPAMCASATDTTRTGSWTNPGSSGTHYSFITFDVSALGAAGSTNTIESATFRATQTAPDGAFYSAHDVAAAKLAYHAINSDVLDAAITADLGVFCSSASATNPVANVLTSFKTDFDAGNKKHLFRLAPTPIATDSTYAHFSCGGFTLNVTQLVQ